MLTRFELGIYDPDGHTQADQQQPERSVAIIQSYIERSLTHAARPAIDSEHLPGIAFPQDAGRPFKEARISFRGIARIGNRTWLAPTGEPRITLIRAAGTR
nr:hypothetical protein GCM10020063_008190 [Dactylosporangium thailandense]